MSSDSISDIPWSLGERKRWQITAELVTCSSLHIGSSEEVHVKGIEHDGESVAINAVVKGCDVEGRGDLPIIPGSTLKGKLRQWLVDQNADIRLMESVFGKEHDDREQNQKKKQGSGGRAEFHDARLCKTLTGKQPYPFWDEKRQTWITASTAIDRHTRTALHESLHYAEAVPPGVVFKVVISGVMEDNEENPEVDILLAALQACRDSETGISLGAGEAEGMGRVQLCGAIEARSMDDSAVCDWLRSMEDGAAEDVAMAMDNTDCTRLLDEKEIQNRAASVLEKAPDAPGQNLQLNLQLDLTLPFDGPFLVSDPVKKEKIDLDQPDLIPLRDNDGKPLLPASSLRGALRSQAERIVRTLGGRCCTPADPCSPLREIKELDTLCPVCQVFGAAGWKTGLRIHEFKCVQVDRTENRQDFVAIDRFHGGGKDGAKFAIEHSERPCFQGKITISSRVKKSGRGLLALVLRDLWEGDITLGFGANKGYGHLQTEAVQIDNLEQLNLHITAFRDSLTAEPGGYPCEGTSEPASYDEFPSPVKPPETRPAQNTFHNPYHFIPVKPAKTNSWLPRKSLSADTLKESSPHHSHALYRQETQDGAGGDKIPLYHGRIICRLETETSLFIGAEGKKAEEQDSEQEKEQAKKVENYRLNGALAIPATSLRGMISGLAEAASNSAMRVLENGVLSFRKIAENALRDIGMVVSEGDRISVLPLSSSAQAYKLKHAYSNHAMMNFLDDKHSWSPQHNTVYYTSSPGTVPDTTYANGKTPGILRILGKDANRIEELQNKLHELFIKIPQQYVDTETNRFDYQQYLSDQKHSLLPVPEHVRERYQDLADERSRSQKSDQELQKDIDGTSTRWLPFHLKGVERERDATDRFCTLPLRHGDLVWYSIEGNNVAEISFSSIWRSRVEDARKLASKVGSFFPDQELLPFNPKRKHISPAELLFGFVEDFGKEKGEQSDQEDDKEKPLSFAGKVRASAGVLPADALEQISERIASREDKIAELDDRLDTVQQRLAVIGDEIAGLEQTDGDLSARMNQARTALQEGKGRQASLEALQEAALAETGDVLAGWLEERGLAGAGRLVDHLEVEPGWDRAVESVLGDHLCAVCTDAAEEHTRAAQNAELGALSLFDTAAGDRGEPAASESLRFRVKSPWSLDSLLGAVSVADGLEQALLHRVRLKPHERIVTPDGLLLGPDWIRLPGGDQALGGVIARAEELKTLQGSLDEIEDRVRGLEGQQAGLRERRTALREERDRVGDQLGQLNRELSNLRSELTAERTRLEHQTERRAALLEEREDLAERTEAAVEEMEEARERLHELLETVEHLAEQREVLVARREGLRAAVARGREAERHCREQVQALDVSIQSRRASREAILRNLERARDQEEQLRERREELTEQLEDGIVPLEDQRGRLEEQLALRIEVEEQLGAARDGLEALDAEVREMDQERHRIEKTISERQRLLDAVRLARQERLIRRRTLEEQLGEAGTTPGDVLQDMDSGANEPAWQEELAKLGNRIQRLGAINLAAIDEYAEQSERKGYLDAQHDDISRSLETLEQAIRKIDRETRTRFRETYDQVNQGFQQLFPRLFGGGHAYLDLTDEDLLETGVAVMARPPGKRNSSIHLLSGGEKALTAVALVFAIFQLNPAPFCMLDEVDAPLDDANVGRFSEMVRSMSDQVQFIFISHNKVTMEIAEHLLGVTMHEPGVSRLVSVDVEEAARMAGAA